MSGIALIWAANVRGLKPAAKIVLIQLADFHNKESGQCNPSAQRLADECEMGRSTVFRHMTDLEELGLLTRVNRGDGKGGRSSSQYNLHLDIVLGASSKHMEKSQIGTGGKVPKTGGKSPTCGTGVVPNRDRNLTIEPVKEPCVPKADPHTENLTDYFLDFWEAHPRPNDEAHSKQIFDAAVAAGTDPVHIVAAAVAYDAENEGNRRQYIKMSDGWLADARWKSHKTAKQSPKFSDAERLVFWAEKINGTGYVASSAINADLATAMIDSGLITREKLKKRGIAA